MTNECIDIPYLCTGKPILILYLEAETSWNTPSRSKMSRTRGCGGSLGSHLTLSLGTIEHSDSLYLTSERIWISEVFLWNDLASSCLMSIFATRGFNYIYSHSSTLFILRRCGTPLTMIRDRRFLNLLRSWAQLWTTDQKTVCEANDRHPPLHNLRASFRETWPAAEMQLAEM